MVRGPAIVFNLKGIVVENDELWRQVATVGSIFTFRLKTNNSIHFPHKSSPTFLSRIVTSCLGRIECRAQCTEKGNLVAFVAREHLT